MIKNYGGTCNEIQRGICVLDQHRLQATGYAGDPNVNTPNMDRLREIGTDFLYAISNCPVCSPNRASLITDSIR